MNSELVNQLVARMSVIRQMQFNQPVKATVFGVSLGIALVGLLSIIFRKKGKKKKSGDRKTNPPSKLSKSRLTHDSSNGGKKWMRVFHFKNHLQ